MANTSHTDLGTFLGDHSNATDGNLSTVMPSQQVVQIVSDEVMLIFLNWIVVWLEPLLTLLGVVNNVLTIVVFSKMGFKETVNITLISIAICDLAKCTVFSLYSILYIIETRTHYYNWAVLYSIKSLTFASIDFAGNATQVSNVLAAYLAIERCLCVTMPFTVKHLLTRRRVTLTCVAIVVLVTVSYSFIYPTMSLVVRQRNNVSHLGVIIPTQFFKDNYWVQVYIRIVEQFYPFATLIISSVCSGIIVYQLRKSSKLRSKMKSGGPGQLSSRDIKIARMLLVVILVYILYAFPWTTYFLCQSLIPNFTSKRSRFRNFHHVFERYMILGSFFNSLVNLYIFFFMSSEFNQTLKQLFHIPLKAKHIKK